MEYDNNYYNDQYDKTLKKILKTYNSILVKCRNIPISPNKNTIMVDDINSLVNTQIETRKPILYYQEENSTSFMILDQDEVYIYMIKKYFDHNNKVETVIKTIETEKNSWFEGVIEQDELGLLGGVNTALEPVNNKSVFSFFYIDKSKKTKTRGKKRRNAGVY